MINACLFKGQALRICLAAQEVLVELTGLLDNSQSEFFVHGLVIVAKFVLRLSIWCFVVTEPGPDLVHLSRELPAASPEATMLKTLNTRQ